jgi:glycosyltransferase involved in cell wall biosynthesis
MGVRRERVSSLQQGEVAHVAVVTPVYNGASFLVETMDCVQAQSHRHLVHIVLDNASTDETPAIIKCYEHARTPVVAHRNERTLPMVANWNAAVSLVPTEAKYFRVLSADDLIAPNFIARTVAVAERHASVVAVGCGLSHRGAELGSAGWEPEREVFPGKEAAQRFFLGTGAIIAHQILIRRDQLDHRRPFFQEGLTADDSDACLDMFRRGDWGFVHETLATTRDHSDTDSNTRVKRLRLDACERLVLLERHAAFAFGDREGRRQVTRYRRYYMRQLVRWWLRGEREVVECHLETLRRFCPGPLTLQIADALANWPLARLGLSEV